MTEEEFKEYQAAHQRKHQVRAMEQEAHRAQAITIGKTGACSTEITLRGVDGNYLFGVYHPAEVIELINQLSANIGCHIHIKPRDDFASYREWKELGEDDLAHLNGWAPFPEMVSNYPAIGKGALSLDRPFRFQDPKLLSEFKAKIEEQLKLQAEAEAVSKEKENAVATKKAVNQRSTKRSRTATK